MNDVSQSSLGPALREIRSRLRITLAEVSKRTSISASTLSRVENNEASLTYDKLVSLAHGLSVDIAEFFRPQGAARRANVTARRSLDRSDGAIVETPKYLYRYLHTDLSGKRLVPIVTEHLLRDFADFGDYHRHPGEEFLFVIEGTMDLYTEFYAPLRVETGHTAYFDSSMGHAYIAVGDAPCRVLSVMTAPDGDAPTDANLLALQPAGNEGAKRAAKATPAPTARHTAQKRNKKKR